VEWGVDPVLGQPDLPTSGPKKKKVKGRTTKEVVGLAIAPLKKEGKGTVN